MGERYRMRAKDEISQIKSHVELLFSEVKKLKEAVAKLTGPKRGPGRPPKIKRDDD